MQPIIEVRNVTFTYPGSSVPALKNVSLKIHGAKIHCIAGPNGSGKSTLLAIMAGLLQPQEGLVLYKGQPLHEQLPDVRKRFGILFQNPDIMMFNPTVYDEIAYGPRQLYPPDTVDEKVREYAGKLGITHLLERPTSSLSFGEKKLVAIASILSYEPEILLLDEPFSHLHPSKAAAVKNIITDLAIEGRSIVVTYPGSIIHDQLCGYLTLIEKGVIVKHISPGDEP